MIDGVEVDLHASFPSLRDVLPRDSICFAVRTDLDPVEHPAAQDLLAADWDRVVTWRSPARRKHFLAGRSAAALVAARLGMAPEVGTDAHGAPHLGDGSKRRSISITHSGHWALAACVADHTFGLDYEVGLPGRAHLRQRVCGDTERALHDLTDPETPARAYALGCIWTLKEALFKAYGVGLVAELKDVEVGRVAPDGAASIRALRSLHPDIPHPLPADLYAAVVQFEGHPLAVVGCAGRQSA